MQKKIEEELQLKIRSIRLYFGLDNISTPRYPYDIAKWTKTTVTHKYCYYCKEKLLFDTYEDYKRMPDKAATVDHIYFKGDIRRSLNKKTVPCCRECNKGKSDIEKNWLFRDYEDIEFIKASLFKITKMAYDGSFQIDEKKAEYNLKEYNKKRDKLIQQKKVNRYKYLNEKEI